MWINVYIHVGKVYRPWLDTVDSCVGAAFEWVFCFICISIEIRFFYIRKKVLKI